MRRLNFVVLLAVSVLVTTAGMAWGEVVIRVTPSEFVNDLKIINGEIWIATENGVSQIKADSTHEVLTGTLANTLADVHGEVWAGTQNGVYRYQGGKMEPLVTGNEGDVFVQAILTIEDTVWLGARQGLYLLDSEDPESIRTAFSKPVLNQQGEEIGEVLSIENIGGEAWVAAAGNAYKVDNKGFASAVLDSNVNGHISDIIPIDNDTWLITLDSGGLYGPAFRITRNGDAEKIDGVISAAAKVRGDVWLATNKGAFRYHEGSPLRGPVDGKSEPINTIREIGQDIWLGTQQGTYRSINGENFDSFPEDANFNVKRISLAAEHAWFQTTSGVYKLDKDVDISVRLSSLGRLVLGNKVEIRSVRYDREGVNPYFGKTDPRFEAILHSNWEFFRAAEIKKEFVAYQGLRVKVGLFGPEEIYFKVRDSFGNTRKFSRYIFTIPEYVTIVVFVYLLFFGLFLAAPWNEFAMQVIMMPIFRIYGSAAAIPLLLCFRRCRRYILHPYVWDLLKDEELAGCGSLLRPDLESVFADDRKLLIVSNGEDVSPFLKGLVRRQVTKRIPPFGDRIPIYLSLRPHTSSPGALSLGLSEKLAGRGNITDLKLGERLIRKGQDFVYVFDDWDKINSEQRLEFDRFLDRLPSGKIVVVGSSSEVSAPEDRVSAPEGQVSAPEDQAASPPDGQVSPPDGQVSPPDGQVSPPDGQVSPPEGFIPVPVERIAAESVATTAPNESDPGAG